MRELADSPVQPKSSLLASGNGWAVSDVVCTAGPRDRPFEEQHSRTSIAIVVSGTFQYRTSTGRELMAPGSWLLGNAGDFFTCAHEHGKGDRCLSFSYSEELRERVADAAGAARSRFRTPRLEPIRALSSLVARASEIMAGADPAAFEEFGIRALAQALELEGGRKPRQAAWEPSALARVTRVVRTIENEPEIPHDLTGLAQIARLSPYHFLRVFEAVTGVTPHQYLLRIRLRGAAIRLRTGRAKVLDIALASGFGDISNFNRSFRAEFGVSPRAYRFMA